MDRLSHLRDEAGGSRDSSLDSSVSPAYLTANEDSSKYFSLSEIDSSAEVSATKDVTLTVPSTNEGAVPGPAQSQNSTINEDNFSIQNQIDAANILSGGVNIFDDIHDNSPDGNNLVIDDNVELDMQEDDGTDSVPEDHSRTVTEPTLSSESALNSELTDISNTKLDQLQTVNKQLTVPDTITPEPKQIDTLQEPLGSDYIIPKLSDKKSGAAEIVQDTEVVLLIDGNNVNAIDIGNGLYLYRRQNDGVEDLAAVQILDTEGPQPTFKFLKVRENNEGNLEVYEEILEPSKDAKEKDKITPEKITNVTSHINNKALNEVETKESKNITEDLKNDKLTEQDILPDLEIESKSNETTKAMKFGSEARKSPLVGSFTPMTFHSTPNKEGVPLTKTMVDLQLHPNKLPDMAKKTIEVTTDGSKNKSNSVECSKIEKVTDDVILDVMCKPLDKVQVNKQIPNSEDLKITESPLKLQSNDEHSDEINIAEPKAKEPKGKKLLLNEKSELCNTSKSLQDNKVLATSHSVSVEGETKLKNISEVEKKSINNNNAVPFGKWTGADRKEFLNKIKESKPINIISNQNQIKKPNDLNRRDFFKKIDNAKQNLTTQKKEVAIPSKSIIHPNPQKTMSFQPHIPETAFEAAFTESFPSDHMLIDNNKKDNRTEINNQSLIDKTIMDIMEKIPSKSSQELNARELNKSSLEKTNNSVCDKEVQSLIPKFDSSKSSCYSKSSKTYFNKMTMNKSHSDNPNPISSNKYLQDVKIGKKQKDEDQSEEEILEHEPVTGDSQPNKYIFNCLSPNKSVEKLAKDSNSITNTLDKPIIITENEFDKFARRNSVTLENQLTIVVEKNTEHHYSQSVLSMPKSTYTTQIYNKALANHGNPIKLYAHINDESQKKSYSSQVQIAYQSLTANRQKESVIAPFDLEDKKVEVVYVDSTNEFIPYNLNAQGPQLTSNRLEAKDTESGTLSSCDSIDSDFLDSVDYPNTKHSGEIKPKTKHPRKQVLTPVETPELELIEPNDLGHEVSSKRKRKTEDFNKTRNQEDTKYSKSLLPKKTYLLGRNTQAKTELPKVSQDAEIKLLNSNISDYTKEVSSNIDSLVKAAELIENQPEVAKTLVSLQSNIIPLPQTSPVKRGRGRPRKYPLTDDSRSESMSPSSQKKVKLFDNNSTTTSDVTTALTDQSADDSDDTDETKIKENWTMGKINENILCPICNKLFRSEEVVYKHVQHCTKASESQKKYLQKRRSFRNSKSDLNEIDKYEKIHTLNKFGKRFEEKDKQKEIHEIEVQVSAPKEDVQAKKICDRENKKVENLAEPREILQSENKDIIIIEDTPKKLQNPIEQDQSDISNKQNVPTKSATRPGISINNYVCPICGKTFRQMSYLIHHKLQHKNDSKTVKQVQGEPECKSVFACEVCSKKFRKLHHLVQHREMHNQDSVRPKRRSLEEPDRKSARTSVVGTGVDTGVTGKSAGFRCERCDKSFRKLHHLVEHRETHEGVSKMKSISSVQKVDNEKDKKEKEAHPPPQCSICKKTFRKLHHLSEHKETHSNEKRGLSSKDIIHECPMCYMVFPNNYALEKHIIICRRKRRQAAAKRCAEGKTANRTPAKEEEAAAEEDNDEEDVPVAHLKTMDKHIVNPRSGVDLGPPERPAVERKRPSKSQEPKSSNLKRISADVERKKELETPAKVRRVEEAGSVKPTEAEKGTAVTVTKSKQPASLPESDDEEARYMLNPQHPEQMFHKVRAHKRSSLQIVRRAPAAPRRVSLPTAPRPRPRVRSVAGASARRSVPSPGSDDSDTKYSFPPQVSATVAKPVSATVSKLASATVTKLASATVTKPASATVTKLRKPAAERRTPAAERRTPAAERRTSAAKRISFGKTAIPKPQVPKPKKKSVEYRCDCGEVFAAATLLARHTSLAHTPPRRSRPDKPATKQAPKHPARTRAINLPDKKKRATK